MSIERIEAILGFWFGPLQGEFDFPEEKARLWFRGGEAFNNQIREKFGADLATAKRGELDEWQSSPRGTLALIILLDQFTRNLNADIEAFTSDERALVLADAAIQRGDDLNLKRVERAFLYLPFEHSEDLEMQVRSIALFEKLCEGVPVDVDVLFQNTLDYAKQHYEIIKRFGRFPHRNQALDRESSAEELKFLSEPGSSF